MISTFLTTHSHSKVYRNVIKEKLSRLFCQSSQLFYSTAPSKLFHVFFFSEQFELVVSSFSAGEISPQPALRGFVSGQTQDPTSGCLKCNVMWFTQNNYFLKCGKRFSLEIAPKASPIFSPIELQ